jgi:cytochrome c oxidase subunit 2
VTPEQFTAWMQKQSAPAEPEQTEGPVDAKAIFTQGTGAATSCGACHTLSDAGTSGSTGPDLDANLQGRDEEYIRRSIVEPDAEIAQGYNGGIMPSYRQSLSQEQLDALVSYLAEATGG